MNEILLGSASITFTSTFSVVNPSAGYIIWTGTALLRSITIIITNGYISKSQSFLY